MYVLLQISASYFPSFEKADCSVFTLSVGWSQQQQQQQKQQRRRRRQQQD